jgi:hypothetical protein
MELSQRRDRVSERGIELILCMFCKNVGGIQLETVSGRKRPAAAMSPENVVAEQHPHGSQRHQLLGKGEQQERDVEWDRQRPKWILLIGRKCPFLESRRTVGTWNRPR